MEDNDGASFIVEGTSDDILSNYQRERLVATATSLQDERRVHCQEGDDACVLPHHQGEAPGEEKSSRSVLSYILE
jgi:hypothetical protein